MRIIHTADIHLDRTCAAQGLPAQCGNDNRRHLRAVLQGILDRALACDAGAVVITGDLFEHDRVTRETVDFLREAFAALNPMPVLLFPGRHDAAVDGSPYLTEAWPANVHIGATPEWRAVPLPGGAITVHGFGWDHPDRDSASLPPLPAPPEDDRTHLAFGYAPEDAQIPSTLPANLAYVGLGGLHATRAVASDSAAPTWYAGAPESHGFDEPGPHQYLELDVASDCKVSVTPVTVSDGRFLEIVLDCTRFNNRQDLLDAVRQLIAEHPAVPYVRLVLEGSLRGSIYTELDGVRDALAKEAPYLQWCDRCQLAEDFEAIAHENTSLGAFVAQITREIEDAPTDLLQSQRARSRDLGISACRGTVLPVRGMTGAYR